MSSPFPDKGVGCHRTGFQKTCFECVTEHRCRLWQHLVGSDPQTGVGFDYYGCSDEWQTKLRLELSQQLRQAGASTDKVATEVQKFHRKMVSMNQGTIHEEKIKALEAAPQRRPRRIEHDRGT